MPMDAPLDSPSYTQDADMLFPPGSHPYVAPGSPSPTVNLRRLVRGTAPSGDDSNESRAGSSPTQVAPVAQAATATVDNGRPAAVEPRDVFSVLRQGQAATAKSGRRQQGIEGAAADKGRNEFIDEAAVESDEDERFNLLGMGRKGQGDDDDDDGEDDDFGSVEGLVDDEQVPEEVKIAQDKRALERHRSVISTAFEKDRRI
jgi:MRC1-like domain